MKLFRNVNKKRPNEIRPIIRGLFATTSMLIIIPIYAKAEVSLFNGNYHSRQIDIEYLSGANPKVDRVYNSKSSFKGMFGWGWGNQYDVHLQPEPDGSLLVQEYGSGTDNRFIAIDYSQATLKSEVEEILNGAKNTGTLGSNEMKNEFLSSLKSDIEFRLSQRHVLQKIGKIPEKTILENTWFRSSRFADQFIKKTKEGFFRVYKTGRIDLFDSKGRMIRLSDEKNNSIDFSYGKDGHLNKLVDNFNRKMFFSFNTQGYVERIDGESGKTIFYEYNNLGELTSVKTAKDLIVSYGYDNQNRHQLIQVIHKGYTESVSYYSLNKRENIRTLTTSNGLKSEFDYEFQPNRVLVKVKQSQLNHVLTTETYDYEFKQRINGQSWVYKMVMNSNQIRSLNTRADQFKIETIYDEKCELPSKIRNISAKANFYYDQDCRAIKKESTNETVIISYDTVYKKVNLLKKFKPNSNLKDDSPIFWASFQYNEKALLKIAKTSGGKVVSLLYDSFNRISVLTDQDKNQLIFKYNELSLPIEIIHSKLGKLDISYRNSGDTDQISGVNNSPVQEKIKNIYSNALLLIESGGIELTI